MFQNIHQASSIYAVTDETPSLSHFGLLALKLGFFIEEVELRVYDWGKDTSWVDEAYPYQWSELMK